MIRACKPLWRSLRPLTLLLAVSVLIVTLLPADALPAAARHLFQSPTAPASDSPLPTPTVEIPTATPEPPAPTPEPPTPTPEPATATPVPPTATLEPLPTLEPPTPTAELPVPTVEAATPTAQAPPTGPEPGPAETPTAPGAPAPLATPTAETIHLPAVEGGGTTGQDLTPAAGREEPLAEPQEAQPPESMITEVDTEEDERTQTARLIDGLAVLASYAWLACGALLLVLVPVGIILLNRWGRRRRQV